MDLQNIKTFLCLANLENFTRAAEELNYAQSTVTSQIQQLEKELGFPLFERIGRKNHLTSGGKEFLIYANEILSLMEKAGTINQNLRNKKGTLKIGVLESLLFSNLIFLLPQMQQQFPHLEIVIKIGQSTELISLLKQNQLDIIYISNAQNTDSSLQCCYQKQEKMVFAVSKKHPLAKMNTITAKDIFQYSFVATEPTGYCFGRLQKLASEYQQTLQYNITVDSVTAIVSLLKNSNLVAFLPEYALDTNSLFILSTELPCQIYYSQLLCSKDKWHSPFLEQFISIVQQNDSNHNSKK